MNNIAPPHYFLSTNENTLFCLNADGSPAEVNREDFVRARTGPIALLDRDGVLIEKASLLHYLSAPEQVRVLPGVPEAVKYLNNKGIPVVVITNQPGIYKGLFDSQTLLGMTKALSDGLKGGKLDAFFYCPHPAPEEGDIVALDELCGCRKPKSGMLTAALQMYQGNLEKTFMFGDFVSDIKAAQNAGVNPVYIATRHDEFEMVQERMRSEFPHVLEKSSYPTLDEAVRAIFS